MEFKNLSDYLDAYGLVVPHEQPARRAVCCSKIFDFSGISISGEGKELELANI